MALIVFAFLLLLIAYTLKSKGNNLAELFLGISIVIVILKVGVGSFLAFYNSEINYLTYKDLESKIIEYPEMRKIISDKLSDNKITVEEHSDILKVYTALDNEADKITRQKLLNSLKVESNVEKRD